MEGGLEIQKWPVEPAKIAQRRYNHRRTSVLQPQVNGDFILNCVNYLSADDELLLIRSKSFKLGTLNPIAVKQKRNFYVLLNTVGPLILIGIMATGFILTRRLRYSRKEIKV